MKNRQISVGICALNEEKNIARVLREILSQKGSFWQLREIFVYSDGSTDKTIQKIQSVKNSKIKIIESSVQRGKVSGLNTIFQRAQGNIIVLFDADIKLKNDRVIEKLIRPLLLENGVMVAGGNSRPFAPKTFFEKAVYATFQVFEESRNMLKDGNNIFGCTGSCLAVKASFAKQIHLPNVIADDSYIYLFCLQQGYRFQYVNDAVIYYKLPKTLLDYLRQVFRSDPIVANIHLEKYFTELSVREHHRPLFFYIKAIWKVFLKNRLAVLFIFIVNALCRPFFPLVARRYTSSWLSVESTK